MVMQGSALFCAVGCDERERLAGVKGVDFTVLSTYTATAGVKQESVKEMVVVMVVVAVVVVAGSSLVNYTSPYMPHPPM